MNSAAPRCAGRNGKILVMLAILMPTIFGIVGLVLDGGLMMDECRALQHASDAAATGAATDLRLGKGSSAATATANDLIHGANDLPDAAVAVHVPPISGLFAGRNGYVQVDAQRQYDSKFMRVLDGVLDRTIRTRAVAGVDDVTTGGVIVILDADPFATTAPSSDEVASQVPAETIAAQFVVDLELSDQFSGLGLGAHLPSILSRVSDAIEERVADAINDALTAAASEVQLPALPTLTAGLEVEGRGTLLVDGAILVNNLWGGVDENGDPAGESAGPPYGVACMPLMASTGVRARDIRVSGGVDRPENYQHFEAGERSPLQANRLPVPDPYQDLPVPSTSSDSGNVNPTVRDPGHVVVVSLGPTSLHPALLDEVLDEVLGPLSAALRPVIEPLVTPAIDSLLQSLLVPPALTPGVYESITVLSLGEVRFDPGVYIIRGKNPNTQQSLSIIGGWIQANGVLFYITDSAGYDASTGVPDAEDENSAPPNPLSTTRPSVFMAPLLPGSSISGLNDPSSPFDGILIYQRRQDRRPIMLDAVKLVGGGNVTGTIYSKWGHVVFIGGLGTYDLRFVAGTMRVLTAFDSTIAPSTLFPPARDVLLVE